MAKEEMLTPSLQAILNAMADMVRVLNLDLHVCYINKSYIDIFGDQLGKQCYNMFCADTKCDICVSEQAIISQKTTEKYHEFGGRTYWVVASPALGTDGQLIGAVEVFRDVTNEMENKRRLDLQNRQMMSDAIIAAQTQKTLLLRELSNVAGLNLAVRQMPCGNIGGDIFGAFNCGKNHVGVYMADVCGHGVAAALVSVMLVQLIRCMVANECLAPSAVLKRINREFLAIQLEESIYSTMLFMVIDKQSGEAVYSNAGHTASPLLFDGSTVRKIEMPGLPICNWMEEHRYKENKFILPREGKLFIYTDGLTDPRYSTLTEDTIGNLLKKYDGKNLLDRLEAALPQNRLDDATMMLISLDNRE